MRRLFKRRLVRAAVLGAAAMVMARTVRNRRRRRFDPTRPGHDWGTTRLTIDEQQ